MAFGEAVAAKTLELLEGVGRKIRRVAVGDHASDQLVAEFRNATRMFERGHGAAELVCLTGGKTGADHGDLHRLLLEQRYTERLAQHALELGRREVDRLPALPSAQIGMYHVALDRPGPDDRHLDDQIVEGSRLDARQHGHLRPALDLEDPDRVRLADHRIGRRILGRDGGEVQRDALLLGEEIEAALHAGEHPQSEDVDLHEFEDVDIVLVPFDDLAVDHARRLDRHQLVEPIMGQDESARMLRQVPRRAFEVPRQLEGECEPAVGKVEIELAGSGLVDALAVTPDLRGEQLGDVFGQAERLADVPDGALGVIAHHGRAQRAVIAAIGLVDPLHDDLAPLMLEVDIDVGRLLALLADEALEQQIVAVGIDAGDAEHEADRRVGGGAPALTENVLRSCEGHDGVHRQEIGRVAQRLDQAELVLEEAHHLVRHAFGIAARRPFPGELLERLLGGEARHRLFFGILVGELFKREAALLGDRDRPRQSVGIAAEQPMHFFGRLQVPIGMALAAKTGIVDGDVVPDAGDDVLQHATRGMMK